MVVEFFFHDPTSPMLSVFFFVVFFFCCCLNHHFLLSPFNTFTSNDGKVQSGVIGLIIGFTHIVSVKYVQSTHVFKQGILRLLSESSQK